MVMFRKLFSKATIIAISIIFLCNSVLYARDGLRVPFGQEVYLKVEHAEQIREFMDFCKKEAEWKYKSRNPLVTIVETLLTQYDSYDAMKNMRMIELGPAGRTELIQFLRAKGIDIVGIDLEEKNDFIKQGDFNTLLPSPEKYPDRSVNVIYTKDSLGSGLKIKGKKRLLSQEEYRNAIKKLFKNMYRVLKDDGLVIVDSVHFLEAGYTDEVDKLKKSDFEKMGFELLEADIHRKIYIFRKTSPSSKLFFLQTLRQIKAEKEEREGEQKSIDLYKEVCSRIEDLNLKITGSKLEMGLEFCLENIRYMQYWMDRYPDPDTLIPMIFCTGDTPWVGYTFLEIFLEMWQDKDVQEFLSSYGIDVSKRPNMKRVLAFPMDATYPQRRTAYHAFANILNNMFDRIEILEENRRFFYGGLIMNEDEETYREMNDDEWEELMEDLDINGLQLTYPEEGTGLSRILAKPGTIQYRVLTAIQKHALILDDELRSVGGAMITNAGEGPSRYGKGHLGFNDWLTKYAHYGKAYIAPACFSVTSAHGPENKDQIKGTFIKKGDQIIPKMGVITFSLESLYFRKDNEDPADDGHAIVIAEGTKRLSLLATIERPEDINYPPTYLQRLKKVSLITEPFGASYLTLSKYPWWFKPYKTFTANDRKNFFISLALLRNKKIKDLTMEDFLKFEKGEPGNRKIEQIKQYNFSMLVEGKYENWDKFKEEVLKEIETMLGRPEDTTREGSPSNVKLGLNIKNGKIKIVLINPHLDDDFLALLHLIEAWAGKDGYEVVTYFITKGYHAVDDDYMLNILEHMKGWDNAQLKEFSKLDEQELFKEEERLARELIPIALKRERIDRHNFDPWSIMKPEERELWARLLFLRLNMNLEGKLSTQERVEGIVNFFVKAKETKPRDGSRDFTYMEDLKTITRFHEELLGMLYKDLDYKNISMPVDATFYGPAGRGGTGKPKDMIATRKILVKERPDLVVTNSEAYGDHRSHGITQTLVETQTLQLKKEGILPNVKLLGYRGVWERADRASSHISFMLYNDDMNHLSHTFGSFWPSQNPPNGPDTSYEDVVLFAEDMVDENFRDSYDEMATLIGEEALDNCGYLANYRILDLDDKDVQKGIIARRLDVERSEWMLDMAGNERCNGAIPLPDLTEMEEEVVALEKSGIPLSDIVTVKELKAQLYTAKLSKYREQAAKALGFLGTDEALEVLQEMQEKNNEPDSKVTDAVSTSIKSFKALSANN